MYKDKDRNIGTIVLLLLFLIFSLLFSGRKDSLQIAPGTAHSNIQLVYGGIPVHDDATLADALNLPDLQRIFISSLQDCHFTVLSQKFMISDCNRRTRLRNYEIQKKRLVFRPRIKLILPCHYHTGENPDIPVLS